jgi:hypothetical protein
MAPLGAWVTLAGMAVTWTTRRLVFLAVAAVVVVIAVAVGGLALRHAFGPSDAGRAFDTCQQVIDEVNKKPGTFAWLDKKSAQAVGQGRWQVSGRITVPSAAGSSPTIQRFVCTARKSASGGFTVEDTQVTGPG